MGVYKGKTQLISSAQNLTSSFVDLGSEQNVAGITDIDLLLNIDFQTSTANVQVKMLTKHTYGHADEFDEVIKVADESSPYSTLYEINYYEYNVDTDAKIAIPIKLNGAKEWVQFQVKAATPGTTGQIDDAWITKYQA